MTAPVLLELIDLETGEVSPPIRLWPVAPQGDPDRKKSFSRIARVFRENNVTRISQKLREDLGLPSDYEMVHLRGPMAKHTSKALYGALMSAESVHQTEEWERKHGAPKFGRQYGEEGVPENPHRYDPQRSRPALGQLPGETKKAPS